MWYYGINSVARLKIHLVNLVQLGNFSLEASFNFTSAVQISYNKAK